MSNVTSWCVMINCGHGCGVGATMETWFQPHVCRPNACAAHTRLCPISECVVGRTHRPPPPDEPAQDIACCCLASIRTTIKEHNQLISDSRQRAQ